MTELDALTVLGLPERVAAGALGTLGSDAASVVASDPWALLALTGVRPEEVDSYARSRLGAEARPDDPRRQVALVTWLLRRGARDGHTVLPAGVIAAALATYGIEKPGAAVTASAEQGLVVETADGPALTAYAEAERALAEAVPYGTREPSVVDEPTAEWVDRVLADHLTVLTGQPGDRMDRAIGALASGARDREWPVALVGPTAGDAPARTDVHPVAGSAGLVLVTDAQALDVVRASTLIGSASDAACIVLAGDPHALPPVDGPGSPFGDLVASGGATVHDTEQAPPAVDKVATISELATSVAHRVLPGVDAADKQVVLVSAGGAEKALSLAVQLVADSIPRTLGIDPADVMVLGPAARGVAGVTALDAALKAAVDPGDGTADGFDAGDRALTVARAAVGRWPACVLVLSGESAGLISRRLLRTAITRAERHLSIIHAAGSAVAHAVVYGGDRRRRTTLRTLLDARRHHSAVSSSSSAPSSR